MCTQNIDLLRQGVEVFMRKGKLWRRAAACVLAVSMLCSMALPSAAAVSEADRRGNANYLANQGELLETPLIQLPLGAVKARGWLENQLLLQKDNLTGNMHLYNDYNKETSQWLGASSGDDWERGPYYLRGLVALAYELDDDGLKAEAQEWIDWAIESQRDSGLFGPRNDSWWSRMPVLMAIRDYYEATEAAGEPDERVLPFMEKYFRYQLDELPHRPLSNWADARGGDNIDSVFWLYNRVYDPANPDASQWLLDLGTLLLRQTTNWEDQYNNTTVRQHVVNTSQGMKTPPVYYQLDQSEKYRTALQNGIFNMSLDHGRIDGLPNSDEAARDNRSTRGSETCGIVEGLLSMEIAQKVLGDAWIGDQMERLAYNALPAAYTPDFSGHTYYVLQNQVMATLGNHEFDCDHGDSSAFGAPLGFDCCYSNCHMGWPKFVQNMWMATANDGLALVAYGPNSVTAKVADGKTARFVQETDYPFKDAVHLTYNGDAAEFELKLRIPAWCEAPVVTVNGKVQPGVVSGEYFTLTRAWAAGDEVDLRLPSEIETSTWYNDSVAVEKGPLVYGLKIDEDWRTYDSNDARELKVEHQEQSPLREIFPASKWNYGLIVDEDDPSSSFVIEEQEDVALQPFSTDNAPVVLKAKGQIIPEWQLDGNIAGPQPYGPTPYDESLVEDIELIPYGCGRLRITHFPRIGEASDTVVRTAERDSKTISHNGVTYQEFDNVVVPTAANYTLRVAGQGAGTIVINGKYSSDIDLSSGEATVENLKNLLSGGFRFDAKQYNNIRFTGDVQVDEIEVTPVDRSITDIQVGSSRRTGDSIKITTNLDPQETPYRVVYGTESGVYTQTARGFSSGTATLTGLDQEATYYAKVIAPIDGVEQESEEMAFEPASSGGLKPNPNVPAATYNGFNSLNYMEQDWKLYDPQGKVALQASEDGSKTQIRFEKGPDVKAVLNLQDAETWVDYVAEAELSVDLVNNNNCGMMIRGTQIGNGPDNYHGYFVGIGMLDVKTLPETGKPYRGPGMMIGFANGNWNDLKPMRVDIQPGQTYKLKVVVYGSQFAVYLDDELITTFEDDRFEKGTIGLRSYNEAFTTHNVTVRPIEEADLEVFSEGGEEPSDWPPYVEANFSDDFADPDASNASWAKVGDAGLIQVADGKLSLGRSTNIKATTGNEAWSDFAYQAEVQLGNGEGNSGMIFRTSREGSGADNYYGYYFGISGSNYEIGKASNGWTSMRNETYPLDAGPHTLKVLAYHNYLAFYIDGKRVTTLMDDTHKTGKIGLRGYNRAYEVDNVLVRPLTEEEIKEITTQTVDEKEITVDSSCNTLRISYPKTGNATSFKALVGTEPGVYTDEFVDFHFNGYKGAGPFTADKTAVSVPENGTYYVKFIGLNGTSIVMTSNEVEITSDSRADTTEDREKLAAMLADAKALDTSAFTQTSLARLDRAISDAEAMPENASQMDAALATRLLYSAMNAPSSEDFSPVTPPETNKVSVRYTVNTNLTVNGAEQPLSDLTGLYTTETDEALTLAFTPAIEGRTLLSAACNGKDLSSQIDFDDETGESTFTYIAKPGDELQFTFTLVNKMILRQIINTAAALQNGPEYEAAIGTVQTAFDNALENAQAVYADRNASQESVDNAWSKMLKAIHLLSFAEGSTDELESLLAVVDALNESNYTPASWATLQATADEARALVADPEPLKADVDKAYKALKDALMNLVDATNKETLQYYFDTASGIDLDLYLESGKDAFRTALADAKEVLSNANATQDEVDAAASALSESMAHLLLIPNKDALKASVEKAETVDTGKYTAASVSTFQKALDNARSVLNNPQATEQQVQSADKQLTSAQNALVVKGASKGGSSKTTHTAPANTYGAEGTATVGANVAKAASVVSDTTVNFTLKRGSAYCFKMTVVNGNGQAPSFTVGNGDALKTQFVAQIGNVYYYRVWAVGAPGASTGVYTTLNGQTVKHCTVTID